MVRIYKQISNGLKVLQYFTTKEWKFYNDKMIQINEDLEPHEKKKFQTMIYDVDVNEYMKNVILGARQYCMKEDLSTLSRARRNQKM